MKIKNKLLLDGVMLLLLFVCMKYHLTGGFLHELLGMILLLGFVVHVVINLKYYKVILHKLTKKKENSSTKGQVAKQRISMVINIILPICAVVMLVSSIMISKDLFSFLQIEMGPHRVWRTVHIIASVLLLICVLVHLLLHMNLFKGIFLKKCNSKNMEKVWSIASKIIAIIMVLVVLQMSWKEVSGLAFRHPPKLHNENGFEPHKRKEFKKKEEQSQESIIEVPSEDTSNSSVEDYLKNLTCNGCGKRCSLLAPQCGKGQRQAEQAKESYEAQWQ